MTRISSAADLVPYCEAWRELASGMPMRSPDWLLGWWENFAVADDELCVLLFHDLQGALIGLAPLYRQGAEGKGTLRVLGVADHCTHHADWLSAAGWETQVGIEVARFLLNSKSEWKRLIFEAVDADAVAIRATVRFLAENGLLLHQRQINSCWKITLPATWDDYLLMLSRSLRKRCRKLQRDYFDSGKVRVHQAESEAELEEGFGILLKLHAARWGNSRSPLGVFNDRKFRSFHETIAGKLLDRGQLRLAWLECDGSPLAVEYQFVDSDAVYAYQAGADLAMGEYSPGKLTMMAAIQFAIARGCNYFDLLRGDEPYKANWRAASTACHDLRVWPREGIGYLAWGLWSLYTWMARLLKQIIPPRFVESGLRAFHSLRGLFDPRKRTN